MEIFLSVMILFWMIVIVDGFYGMKKMKPLERQRVSNNNELLSVIVAARNEEQQIEESLLSQFQQTYTNVEWIVVNDRSTDMTAKILSKLERGESRLQVIHIDYLPQGWLGKNYALFRGYQQAQGNRLLFTDADVIYEKEAFSKAISYASANKIDHLTLTPNLKAEGFWLKAFVAFFLFGFSYFKRPWMANSERSKQGTGIGAFNMLTRQAYEAIGTHKSIALRPDDDLQLGIKIKQAGFRQRLATALHLIKVTWYDTLPAAIQGLEKNAFAGLFYRISMVVLAAVGVAMSQCLPFVLLLFGTPIMRWYSLVIIVLIFVVYQLVITKMTTLSSIHFLVFPLTAMIFIYTILRATYLTYRQGGIVWRGTFYTLEDLRKG
ncbi:glycosyltransferase [Tuberibacillus sp. Marseille-P3662]|uniref:glycosyltransferase n=1 Tax=Tuberibacillus sp. Marseille-P3662 TaxID=1965358 RepID=UPI000A1CA6A3|nr:glycosyltransferase family 2 protein [Tuberibacillus sp. Marseille-P3662]